MPTKPPINLSELEPIDLSELGEAVDPRLIEGSPANKAFKRLASGQTTGTPIVPNRPGGRFHIDREPTKAPSVVSSVLGAGKDMVTGIAEYGKSVWDRSAVPDRSVMMTSAERQFAPTNRLEGIAQTLIDDAGTEGYRSLEGRATKIADPNRPGIKKVGDTLAILAAPFTLGGSLALADMSDSIETAEDPVRAFTSAATVGALSTAPGQQALNKTVRGTAGLAVDAIQSPIMQKYGRRGVNKFIGKESVGNFGQNAGRGVGREGIIAFTDEGFAEKIGQAIESNQAKKQMLLQSPAVQTVQIDMRKPVIDVFADKNLTTVASPEVSAAWDRFSKVVVDALDQETGGTFVMTPAQADAFKWKIGAQFKKTFSMADENLKAQGQRLYSSVDRAITDAVPNYGDLDSHLADLHQAAEGMDVALKANEWQRGFLEEPTSIIPGQQTLRREAGTRQGLEPLFMRTGLASLTHPSVPASTAPLMQFGRAALGAGAAADQWSMNVETNPKYPPRAALPAATAEVAPTSAPGPFTVHTDGTVIPDGYQYRPGERTVPSVSAPHETGFGTTVPTADAGVSAIHPSVVPGRAPQPDVAGARATEKSTVVRRAAEATSERRATAPDKERLQRETETRRRGVADVVAKRTEARTSAVPERPTATSSTGKIAPQEVTTTAAKPPAESVVPTRERNARGQVLQDISDFDDVRKADSAKMRESGVDHAIETDARGVVVKAQDVTDTMFSKSNTHKPRLDEGDKLYASFEGTRKALREKYGDTVTLYRADAPAGEQIPNKNVLRYALDAEYAERFAGNGRKVVSVQVPVDDIVAAPILKNGYSEIIAFNPKSTDLRRPNAGTGSIVPTRTRMDVQTEIDGLKTKLKDATAKMESAPSIEESVAIDKAEVAPILKDIRRKQDEITAIEKARKAEADARDADVADVPVSAPAPTQSPVVPSRPRPAPELTADAVAAPAEKPKPLGPAEGLRNANDTGGVPNTPGMDKAPDVFTTKSGGTIKPVREGKNAGTYEWTLPNGTKGNMAGADVARVEKYVENQIAKASEKANKVKGTDSVVPTRGDQQALDAAQKLRIQVETAIAADKAASTKKAASRAETQRDPAYLEFVRQKGNGDKPQSPRMLLRWEDMTQADKAEWTSKAPSASPREAAVRTRDEHVVPTDRRSSTGTDSAPETWKDGETITDTTTGKSGKFKKVVEFGFGADARTFIKLDDGSMVPLANARRGIINPGK